MFQTIKADRLIKDSVSLVMEPPEPVSGWTTGKGKIELQFPPRIRGNSKKANWLETDRVSYEPQAVWKGSGPTNLTVELKYVVGAGKGWGVAKISEIVHNIMGYFYRPMQAAGGATNPPIITIKLYEVAPPAGGGPANLSTWRMNDVSIEQTDELILDNGKVYPQVTTITMNLSMVTKLAPSPGGRAFQHKKNKKVPLLPAKEWY
jgi:hypothetical protein